jgi:glucosamine-6-phosphate deaminase
MPPTLKPLNIHRYESAVEMGRAAARQVADRIRAHAAEHEIVPIVFATGESQLETLRALTAIPDIPWDRVVGFHMDEYIGITDKHPASFRLYLRQELTSKVPIREFHKIAGDGDNPEKFCLQYSQLLRESNPLLCLGGIGENGHLAFNDPPSADFNDPVDVKIAELDQACRQQQVNEGWFRSLGDVPLRAITLTIPALLRIPELFISVPGERKRAIMRRTIHDPISTACPATILRTHSNTHIFVDGKSA